MSPKLQSSLLSALKKQVDDGESETNADIEALRKIAQRQNLSKLKSTVKTAKDVSGVLEDPPLPSAQDLDRWWPEPREPMINNPLIAYGVVARAEVAEMLRLQPERGQSLLASPTTAPVVLPKPPFLPVAPRPSTVLGNGRLISPRSPRHLQQHGLSGLKQSTLIAQEVSSPSRAPSSPTAPNSGSPNGDARRPTPWDSGSPPARPKSPPFGKTASSRSTWSLSPRDGGATNTFAHSPRERRMPDRREPSRNFGGNPAEVAKTILVADGDEQHDAFDLEADGTLRRPIRPDSPPSSYLRQGETAIQLEALDRSNRLAHWMDAFAADEEAFASRAVFVEMRLRQALSSSVQLGVPNVFRTAVVCDAFERVAPMTGRYEGVLKLCWRELIQSLYHDYTHELPGAGAKVYAERTPFFVEVKRLKTLTDEQAKTMLRMKAQRDAEIEALKARNAVGFGSMNLDSTCLLCS